MVTGEEELARSRAELTWVRDRVLNVVGHELRTPASTVRGLADALADSTDPVESERILGALRRHAARLERLVDDLLAASGVRTSLPVGSPSPVDAAAYARAEWADAGGDEGGLSATTALVLVRPESARRILRHVLTNALALGDGTVAVSALPDGDLVALVVDSPGESLPDEDVRFATEAFWRGERAVTAAPGLGLGLAVASALAAHEGGDLRVEALAAGGLRTTVRLPAAPTSGS